jgi:hypothetical protein
MKKANAYTRQEEHQICEGDKGGSFVVTEVKQISSLFSCHKEMYDT